MVRTNSVGAQHIIRAAARSRQRSCVLSIAQNTIDELGRWNDSIGSITSISSPRSSGMTRPRSSAISALGLDIRIRTCTFTRAGGLANLNTIPATINELLLSPSRQSSRLANWPANTGRSLWRSARVRAFLVSERRSIRRRSVRSGRERTWPPLRSSIPRRARRRCAWARWQQA